MSNENNKLLDTALKYVDRGFFIFPLKAKSKKPATKNGFKDASNNHEQIKLWWKENPDANIGIVSGKINGFFVVDIDGEYPDNFPILPDTVNVKTYKGYHLYYKYPDNADIRARIRINKQCIDIKSDGGYIVAPPSVHPDGGIYDGNIDLAFSEPSQELINLINSNNSTENIDRYKDINKNEYSEADIIEMVSFLNPDMDYQEWLNIGMAIHSGGYNLSVWDNWSSQGKKYENGVCSSKWKGFHGNGISIATLIDMANKSGYKSQSINESGKLDCIETKFSNVDIPLYQWSELGNLPKRKYLIKGLIEQGAMSVVYGASNSGKTFIGIDMACHIALGWNWCNLNTRKGKVVYIAGEGGLGISERLTAFKLNHGFKEYADIFVIPQNISLCKEQSIHEQLIKKLSDISDIKMIIIDTLARAMGSGDENSTSDMGSFIQNCDIIRNITNAHVMVIHHSGKDETRGARGSSSLKAAIDTEIKVSQSKGIISAKVEKQREGKTGNSFNFVLNPIKVGNDEDGEPIISCSLSEVEGVNNKEVLSKQVSQTYRVLTDLMIDKGLDYIPKRGMKMQKCVRVKDFKADFIKSGISSSDKQDNINRAFNRAKHTLKDKGYIAECNGYIWSLDKGT